MINYELEATFWPGNADKGIVYRNDTKLILNGNNQGSGIVLMLNPGKCLPKGGKEVIKERQKFSTIQGNLDKDPTQGIVVSCVTYFYGTIKLPDSIFIVNLCDKVEANSENLSEEDFGKKDYNKIIEELWDLMKKNQIKWIWVAFEKMSKDKPYLDDLKNNVLKELKSNQSFKDKVVGECAYYHHPLYINCNSKLKNNLKNEIELKLQNS